MTDERRPERSVVHNTNIHDSQVAYGDHNSFVQHNYASGVGPGEEFAGLLAEIENRLAQLSDPAAGQRQLVTIKDQLGSERTDKAGVLGALYTLAALVTGGGELAEAIGRAVDLVMKYWPFA
jgi:hypothetical protein